MVRRSGGPLTGRIVFSRGGFSWAITGPADKALMTVRLLNKGRGRVFEGRDKRRVELKQACNEIFEEEVRRLIPVDTGHLKDSLVIIERGGNVGITLGPPPRRERRKLKRASRDGKVPAGEYKTYIHKFYARRVNATSRANAGYVQRAATAAARKMNRLVDRFEKLLREEKKAETNTAKIATLLRR